MQFDANRNSMDEISDDSIDIREILDKYLINIKWFIISVLIFVSLTYVKLIFEINQYNIQTSILIKDKEKGSSISDLSSFENLGLFGNGDNGLENEIQILKSRKLMAQVVEELKLTTQYYIKNSPSDIEQYPNYPLNLNIYADTKSVNNISSNIEIEVYSKDFFNVKDFSGFLYKRVDFGKEFLIDLGSEDYPDKRRISIDLNENFDPDLIGETIIVKIHPLKSMINLYLQRLKIEPVDERLSKVLNLSMKEENVEKGISLLNNLIAQYNADGILDKNELSQSTTDFLDLRLGLISAELYAIESTAEQFKTKNQMIDVKAGSNLFLENSSSNETELISVNTQMQLLNYMYEELIGSNGTELLPGNIGLSDTGIINLVSEYNSIILQRNRILKSSSVKNPIIVGIDSQLDVLKKNLLSSLKNQETAFQIQISSLNIQTSKINSRIASVPKNEREFKDIVRQQETKNALYLFLLQKREESILSNAVSVDKAKIIDSAYSFGNPVSPNKMINYLGAVLLGLFVPFIVIFIKNLLDTKVHDEADLERLNIPYLGDIPYVKEKQNLYVSESDNSQIAEAFRYIRTNVDFMLDSNMKNKTIFLTSTHSHEGKTFSAINLASSLAISGKKTILVGLDLRAPKITDYLNLKASEGISNFIKDKSISLNQIILKHPEISNLSLIHSGDIPPNPNELLLSERVNFIFDSLKKDYEYIVVDTAPVGLVTDTILIGKFSQMTIYVVRANFLDKRLLKIPRKLHLERKLPNMAMMINFKKYSVNSYGYGYGYGERNDESKIKAFIRKILFIS